MRLFWFACCTQPLPKGDSATEDSSFGGSRGGGGGVGDLYGHAAFGAGDSGGFGGGGGHGFDPFGSSGGGMYVRLVVGRGSRVCVWVV